MQFHLNGFRVGDPTIEPAAVGAPRAGLPEKVDVLIAGSGPAGLVLAAQLSQFPSIKTCVVERREGPLQMGQADGVACRTVEMFEAFGLSDRLLREAYWVNETVFWRPDAQDRGEIRRTGRVQDTETGLSEFPHVIVNQARVQDYLLDVMRRSAQRAEPHYALEVVDVQRDGADADYPVLVTLRRTDAAREGETVTVRARYVVGCDGARSRVRASIGQTLRGDAANHAWGVMDALAVTNFPDIRLKAAIQSASKGNLLLIPREGGYLVRFYVDLGDVTPENRDSIKQTTVERLIETARGILHPYTLDVKEVAWFSVYEVGQRLTERFDDAIADGSAREPRVFIAGDACHTHSAKAGQGMNVSMQDGFNLGWKLGAVLEGRSDASLLRSYSDERQPVAQELIDFDKEWSAMMAAPPKDPQRPEAGGVDPAELQAYFVRAGRYTAGVATRYRPGALTGEATHQALATGFAIGARFHSSPVVRLADAKPVHLGHAARADGRWRLYAFADADGHALRALCEHLANSPESVLRRATAAQADIDSVLDLRAVLQQPHREVRVDDLPALLLPRKGRHGLIDYEKAFTSDAATDIFDERGIDRARGALVVVRPDQYVAHVLPLDAYAELDAFFAPIFRTR
ncbi:FAD-binding monooxygenase [Paraburkholderia sp. Ac-20347]|uniref:FAD-binding monooxygenase n=1 Tax=Paraburkholderia sp. Ac-20347 TaxID=2703892 RepID=UPI00197D8E94|nr:FAD-binding monooxygenase [Paraburkholderia sp. Ac-20347]MBN3809700.1 3-hydroxybenzoate 4-monooxygenase [Paraburkholderia sp. Ac-20347]